jgi:tellurite resistance protein TerA
MDLQQGANAPVTISDVAVSINWMANTGVDGDVSAYLLTDNGKVRNDNDMIFYNQATGADGAVRFVFSALAKAAFEIDLARVPAEIMRIVFCVTIDQAQARRQTLAALSGAVITVGGRGGLVDINFTPSLSGATEAAMTFGEMYRRGADWKFRAVGQGFNGGLAPLARSFGIDVAEEKPAVPAPPPAPSALSSPSISQTTSAPVNLSKVSLEKPGQSISLEKRGSSFGEILINLNWSRGRKGFFGGGNAIDLDLGCLLEMTDGRKSVVQALGRMFGSYHDAPYIALSGDDRTGDVSAGETMKINGAHWNEIRRVAIFANIYSGVPNWGQTDGVVTVTMPDQPPIEVRMADGRDSVRLCGVVMLENVGGSLRATRIVDYFRDQQELDKAFNWGLRWTAGSKD